MPVTPGRDKAEFWKRLRNDAELLKILHVDDLSTAQADAIFLRRKNPQEELKANSRFVLIFTAPSKEGGNDDNIQNVMEVDVLCAADRSERADAAIDRICKLLNGWKVNGRPVRTDAIAEELAAAPGFYRTGARFNYFSFK